MFVFLGSLSFCAVFGSRGKKEGEDRTRPCTYIFVYLPLFPNKGKRVNQSSFPFLSMGFKHGVVFLYSASSRVASCT